MMLAMACRIWRCSTVIPPELPSTEFSRRQDRATASTASSVGSTTMVCGATLVTARSGSLRPVPVKTQTTL